MPSITLLFESNGRSPPGQSCDVSRTLGWCVSHNYLSLTKQSNESPKATLERTQSTLRDLPVNGFNLFLAKHLKAFTDASERAQFNTSPEMAFSYSDDQVLETADSASPIALRHDLLTPIMSQLVPNAHPYSLVVSCLHGVDKLEVYFTYHTNQFNPFTIQRLILAMAQAFNTLVS
ncbi:hypothetical protein H4R34_005792 [Dimargaris verticillata]|uniref:Condensation domain-containing protein n=1 Tax=Dimargaris verticillata TaxID=2761393 RepID=A0A9W8EAE3_9FUNG|nr:hypothetical protein H4R34_005792 [Dimargaris verticillata]